MERFLYEPNLVELVDDEAHRQVGSLQLYCAIRHNMRLTVAYSLSSQDRSSGWHGYPY